VGDDEVGLEAAGDVEDLRAHLDAGRRHRECAQLEAFGSGQRLEDRQRLLAGRVVVEQVGDLLALEPAQLLLDELHGGTRLRPVARRDREGVGIALAIRRGGRAEAGRRAQHLVFLELLVQRRSLRRAIERLEHRAFLLEALVRFHGRRHLVFVVDLDDLDLVALDTALAVDQVDVVAIARTQDGADQRGRSGAIALHAEHDFFLLGERCARAQRQGRGRGCHAQPTLHEPLHGFLPLLRLNAPPPSRRKAKPGSNSGYSATID
jgi:hypothetical protein